MKKNRKRFLSFLLALSMVLGLWTPGIVYAGDESPVKVESVTASNVAVENLMHMNLTEEGTIDWLHLTSNEVSRKQTGSQIIQLKNLDPIEGLDNAGNTAIKYTWTDGNQDASMTKTGDVAVFAFKTNGKTGDVIHDAGYRIMIPAADEVRVLTFGSGIWEAKSKLTITYDGENTPAYEKDITSAGVTKYVVTIPKGKAITIEDKYVSKSHGDGNITLGGIALKLAEDQAITELSVDEKVIGDEELNLTEEGTIDWVHIKGGKENRKNNNANIIKWEQIHPRVANSGSDSRITYTWTDGTNGVQNTTADKVRYFGHTSKYGYEISVPAANENRVLTFGAGLWNTKVTVSVYVNGEETPVDVSEFSDGAVLAKKYTIDIKKNTSVRVVIQKDSGGNVQLGGVALGKVDSPENDGWAIANVSQGTGNMNLTEMGDIDWVHFTSSEVNRKFTAPGSNEVIDWMNASAGNGRTFGQTSDQVWRYQTFTPVVTNTLTSVEVALIKSGNPSNLIAALYEFDGSEKNELAKITVPADQIVNNQVLSLDFGDITVEAGVKYAIALTQETKNNGNYYKWCDTATYSENGKIKEDGSWVAEDTAASLRVVIGKQDKINAQVIDWLNKGDGGRTFGQTNDQVWRYQTFTPSVTNTLSSVEVVLNKKGTPSDLVAALYKFDGSTKTELARTEVAADKINNRQVLALDFGDVTVEAGVTYAVALTQKTLDGSNHYYWSGAYNPNENGKIKEDNSWVSENTAASLRVVIGGGEVKTDYHDWMNVSATSGRTFGQTSDQVWRYQTFTPEMTGDLARVQVALIKKGSPSDLIAGLYEFDGNSRKELAKITVPADSIESNKALTLDFGDIVVKAGVTYAVALTQETLNNSNLYWWCNASTSNENGKITQDGTWKAENTAASLRVLIGDKDVNSQEKPVNIIQFETVGEMQMASTMGDSAVSYYWSDGIYGRVAEGITTGGVLSYKNGDKASIGAVEEEAGFKLSIPAADTMQTLTFVSGVWQASAEIYIYADGNTDDPIYSNTELTAGGSSKLLTYTITIARGVSVEVYGKLTAKTNEWGNVSLGGVALSASEMELDKDYISLLEDTVELAKAWLNEDIDEDDVRELNDAIVSAEALLADEGLTNAGAYFEYMALNAVVSEVKSNYFMGTFAYDYASGQVASFGWEGDKHAPIAWVDGSYQLRDNGGQYVTFGVTGLGADSIEWYNAEGYLPCFVSEYSKNGMDYKVENFADMMTIGGNKYEIAYSRLTVKNNNEVTKLLPTVSDNLVPLNDAAKNANTVASGQTVVLDYCIGADRFGGTYQYPADEVLAAQGSFDEHYAHMKNYWNEKLEGIVDIKSVPEEYSELINAYKAGYIYTLIIADGYELHVGENGYDRVFDHDVIGMLATLIESGHTEHFADYAQYILMNIQYPDAAWKFSWPFALYLQKTGDYDTILQYWNDTTGGVAGIKTNTHKIGSEREVYDANVKDADGNPARIMKRTDAIDSYGYWVIDNYAALFGLSTYSYLCQELYEKYGLEEYKTEYEWAQAEYYSLLKGTEAVLTHTMEEYDFEYIPISMVVPNELSARKNVQDGNWAAHYLFGRWLWDGYLFGADLEASWLDDMTDQTYDYILEQKSTVFDSEYNMGGYPHGFFSSAYNAGYYSAALSAEEYREYGINSYLWMINNSMSAPFGWWEGISYPNDNSVWAHDQSTPGGGGSCQHMWGQSVNSKVLIDAMLAEKADGTIIAGRGIPMKWNLDGEVIEVADYLCNSGKRIGFKMTTNGKEITFVLTGDALANAVSLELPVLVDNIASVSGGLTYDVAKGTVTIPAGTTEVTVTMKYDASEMIEIDEANAVLEDAINEANKVDGEEYVTSTYEALLEAVEAGETLVTSGSSTEKYAAADAILEAISELVELKAYDIGYDYLTNISAIKTPSFGEKTDERYRYGTFKTGEDEFSFDMLDVYLGADNASSSTYDDVLISIYTLAADNYKLDECVATVRLDVEDVVSGLNTLVFEEKVTLEPNTYYAIHFAMDNSNGLYGSYTYESGALISDDLYAVKIQGSGDVVNESFLGTPKMKMYSEKSDKTALNALVDKTSEVHEELLAMANEVLLDKDATQEEIDAAYAVLAKADLNALIAECEELNLEDYEEEGKDEYTAALAFAKEVAENDEATEDDINEATDRLTAAKNALKLKVTVVTIPTGLSGKTIEEVEAALEALGLIVKKDYESSDEYETDIVISVEKEGQEVEIGSEVIVTISSGSAPIPTVTIPTDLLRKNIEEVKAILESLGLAVEEVHYPCDIEEGTVVYVKGAGSTVEVGSLVEVHVSDGPEDDGDQGDQGNQGDQGDQGEQEMVTIPTELEGMEADEVEQILKDKGFVVIKVYEESSTYGKGMVISVEGEGTDVEPGSEVVITISLGSGDDLGDNGNGEGEEDGDDENVDDGDDENVDDGDDENVDDGDDENVEDGDDKNVEDGDDENVEDGDDENVEDGDDENVEDGDNENVGDGEGNAVDSGDTNNMTTWFVVMILAAACAVVAYFRHKRTC